MALTDQQQRFVEEYPKDFNATQAAIRAGYSPKTAGQQGHRLLKDVEIQQALALHEEQARQLAEKRSALAVMDRAEVLMELSRVARFNMGRILHVTPDGDPYIDLSKASEDDLAAIAEAQVEDFIVGRGDDARDVRRVKIKPHSKLHALELLAKHYGLLVERVEVKVDEQSATLLEQARQRAIKDARRRLAGATPVEIIDATPLPAPHDGADPV